MPFYRSSRERAMPVAGMSVPGTSTWKATAVVHQFCGLDIACAQMSRAATEVNEQFGVWRNCQIGEGDVWPPEPAERSRNALRRSLAAEAVLPPRPALQGVPNHGIAAGSSFFLNARLPSTRAP